MDVCFVIGVILDSRSNPEQQITAIRKIEFIDFFIQSHMFVVVSTEEQSCLNNLITPLMDSIGEVFLANKEKKMNTKTLPLSGSVLQKNLVNRKWTLNLK
jgi:hypothetical protein